MPSKIPWTDETLNPWVGCTKIRAGCLNCYAERQAIRINGMAAARGDQDLWAAYSSVLKFDGDKAVGWNGQLAYRLSQLLKPLHWRKPRRIFWCSMSDPFHAAVPFDYIHKMFVIMDRTRRHTHILLTKRPNILKMFYEWEMERKENEYDYVNFPLPNLWLGISCSTQKDLDEMWPILAGIPAAVRFISLEPLLEFLYIPNGIDWVIVGCERLHGNRTGRFGEWGEFKSALWNIKSQCHAFETSLFIKQIPNNGKVSENPDEWPEWARVRDYPSDKE